MKGGVPWLKRRRRPRRSRRPRPRRSPRRPPSPTRSDRLGDPQRIAEPCPRSLKDRHTPPKGVYAGSSPAEGATFGKRTPSRGVALPASLVLICPSSLMDQATAYEAVSVSSMQVRVLPGTPMHPWSNGRAHRYERWTARSMQVRVLPGALGALGLWSSGLWLAAGSSPV